MCHFLETNLKGLKLRQIFINSFIFSFGLFISFLFWIQSPFFIFEDTKFFFPISILLIILLSLIFSTIFTFLLNLNKILSISILLPIIFVIIEYIISKIFYGFPWVSFSLIISSNDFILTIIKYFGTFITSYLVMQVYCLPYLFLKNDNKLKNQSYFLGIILLPIILIIFMNIFINNNINKDKQNLDLEIFQLNTSVDENINNKNTKLNKIKKHIIDSKSELLIFAENDYPFLVQNKNISEIQNLLKQDQVLIIGSTTKDKDNYFNSLLNITSNEVLHFDKKILVPFGEFIPLRKYFNFMDFVVGPNDFTEGKEKRLININDKINYIPVICYEIIFYWKLINNLNFKSNLIINITNDIWFGNYLGPYQHFYLAKLRAVEFNKKLVRVSNNGISGIFDENGKILSHIKLNKAKSQKYTLELSEKNNFFKLHNFFNLYFFIIVLILFIFNFRKKNSTNTYKKRLFGRTKGRSKIKINIQQYFEELKKYSINKLNTNNQYILDIGTGYGETSVFLAKNYPNKIIISCEKYINGNLNLLKNIKNNLLNNIIIYDGNVHDILDNNIKKDYFEMVWIFFPDPWPKKKHFKRRLITNNFLKKIHPYIKQKGEISIVTDSASYIRFILKNIYESKSLYDWRNQNKTYLKMKDYYSLETKFYKKAIKSGKNPSLFILKKI